MEVKILNKDEEKQIDDIFGKAPCSTMQAKSNKKKLNLRMQLMMIRRLNNDNGTSFSHVPCTEESEKNKCIPKLSRRKREI